MLDYEWGNPSTIMLTGDEQHHPQDQSRQFFDNYDHTFSGDGSHHYHTYTNSAGAAFAQQRFQNHSNIPTIYDLESSYPQPSPFAGVSSMGGDGNYLLMPKSEEIGGPVDFTARIGLNLGHRTYFSSDDDFVNRLYRRSRPGHLDSSSINVPGCQAEGCTADLSNAKHYHRRHKVCEFHSKSSTVIAGGLTQRFCQQCSRFHLLTEFDNGKRSCRKRLADHNRRRRKTQPQQTAQPNQNNQMKSPLRENASKLSSSEVLTRSPTDCGTHSSSSVTVAMSPPRMSLDCFKDRTYNGTVTSSSSNMFFYGNE